MRFFSTIPAKFLLFDLKAKPKDTNYKYDSKNLKTTRPKIGQTHEFTYQMDDTWPAEYHSFGVWIVRI